MRQIVLEKPGSFTERAVPVPIPKAGEALVRIRSIGVCGSDLHAFSGQHPAYSYPRVLGHELGCEVVEVHGEGSGFRPGDRCAVDAFISCGECPACRKGKGNCCETLQYFGVHIDGGMQEYLAVPLRRLHKSHQLTFDQLALVEPLGIGANGVLRANVQSGDEVLIIGLGPIGLAALQFAMAAGGNVRAVERLSSRRALAEQLGVEAMAAPDGCVADVVIDATGNRESMEASFNCVANGGRLVFLGLVQGRISFEDWQFHRRELTVIASRASLNIFPRIIRMIENGQIDTSVWITDRLALADVPRRFASLLERDNQMKTIIEV